ncbi:MAG: hypothetical protein Q8L05_02135 [Actinomycetota bacterium]|nr:hypothetical protein [Actinomycetota bacterium]MDP2288307.1 hypothetical protein [Actinomycetota bacterium]
MPDLSLVWQQHQSEIIAVLAGALGAMAFLALIRKAIKWFVVFLVLASITTAVWLTHEQDLFRGTSGFIDLLR